MSTEREAALRYICRVLGMQPSVRAQLDLRVQQVELLTAEVEEARAERDDALRRLDAGVLDLARARGVHPDVIRLALGTHNPTSLCETEQRHDLVRQEPA